MAGQTHLPIEILDYVQTHAPPEESPFGISQNELARALGYHPCSMSRPLGDLVRGGQLVARRALVREGVRKQLTYRITELGRARLHRETREIPVLSGEIPAPPHPFLGRKEELGRLAELSRGEDDLMILIDGPPGMGKTALVSRHLRDTRRGRIPFWFTARSASSPRHFVTALAHSLQRLGAQQLAYYAQLPRPPTAKEVADLLRRLLGDRKMVAVVDDIHLAGSELRRFLTEFTVGLMRGDGHRLYFISQEASFEELGGVLVQRLTVGGLDRAAAYELTDRAGGLSDRFEAVYQTTMGSPLLLNLAVLNPGITGPATDVPSGILRQLPEREIDAILPLAIANYPLPPSFLEREAGLAPDRVRELTRVGVLHPTVRGQIEMLQVVRNALLHQIRPSQEHQAHLRLALYYSRSRHPDSVRQRFIHLVEGEASKPALQILARQERLLLSLGYSDALRNAFRHLSTVLPRGPSRLRALTSEVKLLRQHSNYSEAIASLRRAIVEADHDPALTGLCHLAIADLLIRTRQVEGATAEFAVAREIGPVTRRLQAFSSFVEGRIARANGRTREAELIFQRTFEFARRHRLRDLALESIAAWTTISELHGGHHEETLRVIANALPEARAEGRVDVVFNLLLVRSRAFAVMGLHDRAEKELLTIRLEAESLGYVNQLAYALSGLAALTAQVGRDPDSATYARQAISLAERLGNDLVLGHTLGILCAAELRMSDRTGDPQLVRDAILQGERGVEILSRHSASDSLAIAHGHLAEAYHHIGDRPKALENFASAAALAEELDLDWMRKGLSDHLPDLVSAYDQLVSSKNIGPPRVANS